MFIKLKEKHKEGKYHKEPQRSGSVLNEVHALKWSDSEVRFYLFLPTAGSETHTVQERVNNKQVITQSFTALSAASRRSSRSHTGLYSATIKGLGVTFPSLLRFSGIKTRPVTRTEHVISTLSVHLFDFFLLRSERLKEMVFVSWERVSEWSAEMH